MASTYSTNLKLELMGTGDQSGTWGDTTNTNLGTLLEQAIVGYETQAITDGADTVLTIANGASSTARNYVLQLTGALTANRNLIVPAIEKSYIIHNATTGGFSVTVKVSGQTGVTVANGKRALVYNNGTDIIEFANAPVTEAGTQTLTNKTLTSPTINTPTISGATVISDNSSGNALRITQTGAGNALVVEDSANPDSTPVAIDTDGHLIVGATTYQAVTGVGDFGIQNSALGARSNIGDFRWSNDAIGPQFHFLKSRGATTGTQAVVSSGDQTGGLVFYGSDGTSFIQTAIINAVIDGTPGTNDMPGRLVFSTTADGASSPTERFRIGSAGQWGIGGATYGSAGAMFMSNGAAAAPSWQKPGTRVSSAASITSPLAWNSDNFDQYAYTALANNLTINADAGTPVDGQKAIFRIQDNGTARVITFTGGSAKSFEPIGTSLIASGSNWTYTTTINKKTYFGCIFNAADNRWDILALSQEA